MKTVEVPIMDLLDTIHPLTESPIVSAILRDPTNTIQVSMLSSQLQMFGLSAGLIRKLQNVGNMLVTIGTPANSKAKSYTATVRMTNLEQLKVINHMTARTRTLQLKDAADTYETFSYVPENHIEMRTIRPELLNNLLPKCVNAMGDLSLVITESAEANGGTVDEFIKKSVARTQPKYSLPLYCEDN